MSTTTKIDTGGQAAPLDDTDWGMTLLDHFAGLAMQVMIASGRWVSLGNHPRTCEQSYAIAQAMIAEKRRLEGGGL